jgi:hypothetical protein
MWLVGTVQGINRVEGSASGVFVFNSSTNRQCTNSRLPFLVISPFTSDASPISDGSRTGSTTGLRGQLRTFYLPVLRRHRYTACSVLPFRLLGFAFNAQFDFLTLLSVILLPFYSNSQTRKFVHSACRARNAGARETARVKSPVVETSSRSRVLFHWGNGPAPGGAPPSWGRWARRTRDLDTIWFRTAFAFVAGRSTAENHHFLEPPRSRPPPRFAFILPPAPRGRAPASPSRFRCARTFEWRRSVAINLQSDVNQMSIRCNQCSALRPLSGGCWDWAAQRVPARPSRASTVAPVRGHQRSSEVIRGHQRSSEVIREPLRQPHVVALHHQRSSEVIRGHQRSSEVIRGHQRSSEVIRGHQRSSEVIRGHQRSLTRRTW